MEQSIASSETDVSAGSLLMKAGNTALAQLWLATASIGRWLAAGIRYLRSSLRPGITTKLDIDQAATSLRVEKRARSDGANELPPSAEELVSGTQREIIFYFRDLQRKARRRVGELTDKLRTLADSIDVPEALSKLRNIPSRCENKILRLNADFRSQYNLAGERELQQQQHYEDFREKNQLNRIARYPGSPIYHFTLLAILTTAGAVAIGKISLSGLGGEAVFTASQAFSISLLQVFVPFFFGSRICPSMNHISDFRSAMGQIGAIVAIVFVAALAYFTAFYIAAMRTEAETTLRSAYDLMLVDPLVIGNDVVSWIAFGIVALAALLAYLIGRWSDDPYPGYGEVQRAYYQARDDRAALTNQLRKRINAIVDDADTKIGKMNKAHKSKYKKYVRLIEESKQIPAQLADYDIDLEDACNILLDRYRSENCNARQSAAPVSFSEHISFRPEHDTDFSALASDLPRPEDLRQSIGEFDTDVLHIREALRELNGRAIGNLEDITWQHGSLRSSAGDG